MVQNFAEKLNPSSYLFCILFELFWYFPGTFLVFSGTFLELVFGLGTFLVLENGARILLELRLVRFLVLFKTFGLWNTDRFNDRSS